MPTRSSERPRNLLHGIVDFAGQTNIFISLCAASLTAWSQKLFLNKLAWDFIVLTFSATFFLYNGQRMYLSFFHGREPTFKNWYYKNKYAIFFLMLVAAGGLYPLAHISLKNLFVYVISFLLGIFYFLPFSNLRSIPVVKSFTVGAVWTLVCVVAPLEDLSWSVQKIIFCVMQLLFISALCVLFNIRDKEEDERSGTHSLPVLYGIGITKKFNYAILLAYLALSPFVELSWAFMVTSLVTFLITCVFTRASSLTNHPFFYSFGVDGLILLQSALGIILKWK